MQDRPAYNISQFKKGLKSNLVCNVALRHSGVTMIFGLWGQKFEVTEQENRWVWIAFSECLSS